MIYDEEKLQEDIATLKKTIIDNKDKIKVGLSTEEIAKDSFRVIPHNLYRAIYTGDFNKAELKIILYMLDLTIGFRQEITDYGVSSYHIAKVIDMDRSYVSKKMKSLEKKNVIKKYGICKNNGNLRYFFNRYFEYWDLHNKAFIELIEQEKIEQVPRMKKKELEDKKRHSKK